MPNLFISYRRDDAPAYARLVYGRLREWFGEASCFMDVEQIALGDDWKRVLDERVSRCDVLIAVIGPGWLTAARGEGRRRLDDPEDFVRWEIREAFVRGKRVIPVLMEGAALLRADDLPPDLARLASLEAQTVTHARFDKDVESLIDAVDPDGRIPDLARRFSRLTRMGKASVAVAALVAAATIALAWANAFDLLGLDTRTASLTMLLGDLLFEVPLSSELVLVGIRPRPEDTNGLDPSHRREYAQLVDIASQGGARTVAFDLRLESTSAFDAELVRSVRAAGERRTAVIFGFQELVGGDPVTPPDLARVARVGLTCVGAKLEKAVLGTVALRRGDRAEHPLDAFQTRMDINGRRYGFEFHADVLNALLNDAAIRPMPFSAQWLMVLLMIVVAAAYRLWRLDLSHRWDGLVLVAGCALYLAVTVIVYAKFQLLADGLYHIAAFVGTWWLLAVLERRRFRGKRTARSGWPAGLVVSSALLGGCASQVGIPHLYAEAGVRVERPSKGELGYQPGMVLQAGDIVETAGGVAIIDFHDDDVVVLRQHTRIQLGSIRLFLGEVFARISTLAARGGGHVITDEMSASVKGTEYSVRRAPVPGRTAIGSTTVIVRQGTVSCEDPDRRRQPVSVTPDHLLRIEGKQAPPPLKVVNAKAETAWADEAIKFLRRWHPWNQIPRPVPHLIAPWR